MALLPDEYREVASQNQRCKALTEKNPDFEGTVTTYWKGGKIQRFTMNCEFHPEIYEETTEIRETKS